MGEIMTGYILPCLWASLACVGFGLVFNIQGVGVLICGLGLGWAGWLLLTVRLGMGDILLPFWLPLSSELFGGHGPHPPLVR